MLTPGIEYFGAASDDDAIAFADGTAATPPALLRADGVTPDGHLAVLGSLLSACPIPDLLGPPALETLSVERRGDSAITLLRVPEPTTAALLAASAEELDDVAHRAASYPELAIAHPAGLAPLLHGLAEVARSGRLYARLIGPVAPQPSRPRSLARTRRTVLLLGMGAAAALLIAGVALATVAAWSTTLLWFLAAIVLSIAIGSFHASRSSARLHAVAAESPGALVTTVLAGEHFLRRLETVSRDVLGVEPPPWRFPQPLAHLVVDPSGVTVRFDDRDALTFPSRVVRGVAAVGVDPVPGQDAEPATMPGIVFVLAVSADESEAWSVAVVDPDGRRLRAAEVEKMATRFAAVVGARSTR